MMLNLKKVAPVNVRMIKIWTQMIPLRLKKVLPTKRKDSLHLLLNQPGEQGLQRKSAYKDR